MIPESFLRNYHTLLILNYDYINSLITYFQIIQYTPEDHPDNQNLSDALSKAEELCSQVNEGVRERENSNRLEWIQCHVQCDGLSEVRNKGERKRERQNEKTTG